MGDLLFFPGSLPGPTGDPYLDGLEMMIIRKVIDHLHDGVYDEAFGLAQARESYLVSRPALVTVPCAERFLGLIQRTLRALGVAERARIRHPACSRARAHSLMENHEPLPQPSP